MIDITKNDIYILIDRNIYKTLEIIMKCYTFMKEMHIEKN